MHFIKGNRFTEILFKRKKEKLNFFKNWYIVGYHVQYIDCRSIIILLSVSWDIISRGNLMFPVKQSATNCEKGFFNRTIYFLLCNYNLYIISAQKYLRHSVARGRCLFCFWDFFFGQVFRVSECCERSMRW